MRQNAPPLPVRWLLPREFIVTDAEMIVGTVLGSCVAVCLWRDDPPIAAVCHCVLPTRVPTRQTDVMGAYVDETLRHILERVQVPGERPRRLTARVIGGAAMRLHNGGGQVWETVGAANITAARRLLAAARVPVVREIVGGSEGRRIRFHTATGEVMVQSTAPAAALQDRDARLR